MTPLRAAYWYFSVVFTVAFLLKPIEFLWLQPHLGDRGSNWSEMALMLLATAGAARWVVLKLEKPASPRRRLCIGLIGLAMIAITEFTLTFWIRRLSVRDYLTERDLAATATYGVGLVVFTVMPLLVGRK